MTQDKTDVMDIENCLALMTLYRDEWKQRDQVFISYFWRFVYLSLIVTFLPNFLEWTASVPSLVIHLPVWIFSLAGILCSLFGLYFGLAENERITKLDEAYRELEKIIPFDYRVKQIDEKLFRPRLNILLCCVVYGITTVLAIINLLFSIFS